MYNNFKVYLGANACILGRNKEKTESMARDIASARKGAKVLGLSVDVRDAPAMEQAAERCVQELGSIDFAM
jgi:2,4-dienoyl-CoA reductase [(3E)-enoyl-CoA-producing], peroxisomal